MILQKQVSSTTLLFCLSLNLAAPVFCQAAETVIPNLSPSINSSNPVTAEVTQTVPPLTEQAAAELITLQSTSVPLNSKLQKRYAAYKINMISNYPGSLQIMSGGISKAIDGQLAYQIVKSTVAKSLFGLFVPFIWILVTPISAFAIHHGNAKAEQEAIMYPGQIPLTDAIHKSEAIQFSTLVPAGQRPQIRLVLKDKASGFEFVKNSL